MYTRCFFFHILYAAVITLSYALQPLQACARGTKHVSFSLNPQPLYVQPGKQATLRLTMTIDAGWYTYGLVPRTDNDGFGPQATVISLATPSILHIDGKIKAPKPKQKFDQGFQIDIEYYEGSVTFDIPVRAISSLLPGKHTTALIVTSMTCNAELCLPATEDTIPVIVQYYASAADTAVQKMSLSSSPTVQNFDDTVSALLPSASSGTTLTESQAEIAAYRTQGIWAFLLFAMGAGASALLTPCVFPMIPITVSFFTKRAEQHRRRGLRDSLVYALGIILTFTALGLILSLFFGATGISDFAANPWVNLFLALLFLVFALNLFGAFEIPLPTTLLNRMNAAAGSGESIVAVLLMAITFSITSFTCTVPFVGAALISAATGEWFYPAVGMLGFSSVFALPFVALALFPSAMQRLPKAGGWMNNVKVVMGFLEIAAAMKFVSNSDLVWSWGIVSRDVFLAVWVACALMIALYVLGIFRLTHDSPIEGVGAPRIIVAMLFTSVAFYLLSGMMGKSLGELDAFLPPADYNRIIQQPSLNTTTPMPTSPAFEQDSTSSEWLTSYEQAMTEAQRRGKPLFIDFTGFTCTNCRWMEANIFPDPDIQALMNNMVKLQLFTDRKEEPYISHRKRQLEQFGSIELPLYVLLRPNGEVIATKTFTRSKAEFLAFLRKASS